MKQQNFRKPMKSKVIVAEIDKHNHWRRPLMMEAWQQASLDLRVYHRIVKTRKYKIWLELQNVFADTIAILRGWWICSLFLIKEPLKRKEGDKLQEIPIHLSPEAREKIRQTLEEFKDILSKSPRTSTIFHHINTGATLPIRQTSKPERLRTNILQKWEELIS